MLSKISLSLQFDNRIIYNPYFPNSLEDDFHFILHVICMGHHRAICVFHVENHALSIYTE